ncbi:lasso peptide biosynthesis PqqD family chaperone [Bacteroidota bacterium]
MMSLLLNLESVINRNPNIIASEIDEEKVMMSIEMGEYFGIDKIGSRIWDMIEKKIKIKELIENLQEEFEVDQPTCEHDVFEFLTELYNKKLIEVE